MRSKRFGISALLCLFFAVMVTPLFAQEEWYLNKPIKNITFENLHVLKSSDLDGVTSSYLKKDFTYDLCADLVDRLFALDYFDDIVPSVVPGDANYSTVVLKLRVEEFPSVKKIVFKGDLQLRTSELKEAITLKENEIYVQSNLNKDIRALLYLYTEKGYTNVKITGRDETDDSGNVTVTFEIEAGRQTVVKTILFEGNTQVSSKTLKGKLNLKEVGFFNNGSYQDSVLEQDRKTIVAYYQDRGYIETSVVDVKKDVAYNEDKKRDEITITFVIQEGGQYNFGGFTFKGNKIFTTEQLSSLVKLSTGSVYNATKFQESCAAIENLYSENGYLYNQYSYVVSKDSENNIVSYTVNISENMRAHVENVLIKGNTKTKDEVIRREIPIESGDIYSTSKLYTSWRSLYNLQYFSSVTPNVTQGSEEGLVDITFAVEDTGTTQLEFGLSFNGVTNPNDFPISLSAKLTDSNLFGTGRSVSGSVSISTDEQSVSLGYGQNWIGNLPINFSVSAGYSHQTLTSLINHFTPSGNLDTTNYYMEYDEHELNLSASLGYRWVHNFGSLSLTGGISGSLVNNIYDAALYNPTDAAVSENGNGWFPKNSLWASFSADGRDISYDPSSGWYANETLTWNGLFPQGIIASNPEWGESQFYLRSDTKGEYYWTLVNHPFTDSWSLKLILMAYSGFSFQIPVSDQIKTSNMLYIDGMFHGRGWSLYNSTNGRGQAMWNNSLELRMPVVPNILAVDLYADASMLKPNVGSAFSDFANGNDWYFSFGPSMRFLIQQLPLRLLFASTFQVNQDGFAWKDKYGSTVDNFMDSLHFVLSFNMVNR